MVDMKHELQIGFTSTAVSSKYFFFISGSQSKERYDRSVKRCTDQADELQLIFSFTAWKLSS